MEDDFQQKSDAEKTPGEAGVDLGAQAQTRPGKMRLYVLLALIYLGAILAVAPLLHFSFSLRVLLEKYGLTFLGMTISAASLVVLQAEISKRKKKRNDRFVDVDARSRLSNLDDLEVRLQELKIRALNQEQQLMMALSQASEERRTEEPTSSTFEGYFQSLRRVLEQKSDVADEKASILLDKGVTYSRRGIYFFVVSIAIWQVLAWAGGFKEQYIFGMVSCSLLFVFIEFLSAWFLKQYRHFVDTSTYLIKVKSIFDRFMLSYLAAQEFGSLDEDDLSKRHAIAVLDLLRDDIKWPDSYLLKNADAGFAKETIEALASLTKAMSRKHEEKATG